VDEIGNAVAVLGVYFALMAVLSVAVEAVVGWFKIPIPWLQSKPSPGDVINEVQYWLPIGSDEEARQQAMLVRITALNKALEAIGEIPLSSRATPAKIAETVGKATTKYIKLDRNRRAVIRAMTIGGGIAFAVIFRIDTVALLAPVAGTALDQWLAKMSADTLYVIGLVLSGIAASAGSSFWHDQSARLRGLKNASQAVGEAIGASGS
jgi:hypothetical protein